MGLKFFVQFPEKLFLKTAIKAKIGVYWGFSGAEGAGKFC